jgi:cytochrome P450
MLHVLRSPDLTSRVRDELIRAGYSNLSPAERISILPSKAPLLQSIWFETLRMHNNLLTVREVTKDLTLSGTRDWKLQKGSVVSIPATLVHFDEGIHPSPEEFHPERFLDRSLGGEGENPSKTLKPFGGGSTYCPGRIFGEKQFMGFIAALVVNYDIEVTGKDWSVPPVSDFDDLWKRPRVHWKLSKREN